MSSLKLAALLLILAPICVASARPETLVRVQTWGAPWTDRFDVTLFSDGVLKARLVRREKSKETNITLPPKETEALHDLAKRALTDPKMADCNQVADGTSSKLTVKVGDVQKSQECLNTSKWPPLGTAAEELVKRINAKLPKNIQVY